MKTTEQGRPGQFDYQTIPFRTEFDFKNAELMQKQGWKIICTGMITAQIERKKITKN